MSSLQTIRTLLDDEQRNCEYLVELRLEADSELSTVDWDQSQLPLLVDVEVIQTRQLDAQGRIARRHVDPVAIPRVLELLDDPVALCAAIENQQQAEEVPSPPSNSPATALRRVVSRRRATNDRRQMQSIDQDAG